VHVRLEAIVNDHLTWTHGRGDLQRDEQRPSVVDDANLLAYATDDTGFRQYTLFVKDLRTGHSTSQVQAVMDGDLDAFIQAYLSWQAAGCPPRVKDSGDE